MSFQDKQIKIMGTQGDADYNETPTSTNGRLNNSRGNNHNQMQQSNPNHQHENEGNEKSINDVSGLSNNNSLMMQDVQGNNQNENDECEECDEHVSTVFCRNCGQKLCKQCDLRIHNRGKRLLHKRESIQVKGESKGQIQQTQQGQQQQYFNSQAVQNQQQFFQMQNQNQDITPSKRQLQQQNNFTNPPLNLPIVNAQNNQVIGNYQQQYQQSQQSQQQQQFQLPSTPNGLNPNLSSLTFGQGTPSSQTNKSVNFMQQGQNSNIMTKIGDTFTFSEGQSGMLLSGGNKQLDDNQQQQMLYMFMQMQQQMQSPRLQDQQPQFFSQPNNQQQQNLNQQVLHQQQYQQFYAQPAGQQQQPIGFQQNQQPLSSPVQINMIPANMAQSYGQQYQNQQQNQQNLQQSSSGQTLGQQQQFFVGNFLNNTNVSASIDNSYDQNQSYNMYNSFNQYKINPENNGNTPTMNNDESNPQLQTPNLAPSQNPVNRNFSEIISSSRQNKTFNVSVDHGFSFGDEQENTSFMSQKNNANNIPVNPIEISLYQDFSHFDSKDIQQEIAKKILIEHAKQGDLLVKLETFKEEYQKEVGKGQFVNIEKIVKNLEQKQVIHSTIRKFGDSNPIQYISIHLNQISIEVVIWIILSIRNDEMTPNEKMVLSRIKECYGVKINQLYWNGVILYIKSIADINGDIIFNKPNILNLKLKKIKDPLNNTESYLMYVKDTVEWIHSDNGPILHEDKDLWRIFIEFIKEFFQESEPNALNTSSSAGNVKQKHKWTSSVENVHTKSTKKTIVRPPKSINKAIPGGRYGCAQLLKCCGPLPLRSCSLGKLSLFVQEAITRGILVYYKTLLIKPTNFDFDEVMDITVLDQHVESEINNTASLVNAGDMTNRTDSQKSIKNSGAPAAAQVPHVLQPSVSEDKLSKEQIEKIQLIKTTILEILLENKRGVSLARLPKLIQKKIEFTFDLHELGFPKLKSLLQTIADVIIENDGTTQAQAVLKQNLSGNLQTINQVQMQNSESNGSINGQQQIQQNRINKITPSGIPKSSQNNAPKFFGNSPAINVQDQEEQQNQNKEYQSAPQPQSNNNQNNNTNQNNTGNNIPSSSNTQTVNNQRDLSPHSYNKKFCTLKPDNYGKKAQNLTNGRTYSNLDDYRSKVIGTIQSILNDNQYGLMSYKLNELLNQKLNAIFEYTLFGCKNFNEFLTQYTESFADILVKQNNFIIYSKNSQLNPLTMRSMHPKIHQQSASVQGNLTTQQQNSSQQSQQNYGTMTYPYGQSIQQQQGQQSQAGDKNIAGKQMQSPHTKYEPQQQYQQGQKQLMSNSCNSSFLSSPPQFKNDSFFHNNSQISQSFTNFSINITGNQPSEINNQVHEESHNELDENLKFIEELLNDEDKQSLGHHRRHSSNSTGTFRAFQGYDNNIFYNQLKSPQNNYQTQRKYSPLYSNDFPEIIHEEPNQMHGYKYGQQGHHPSQFGHQPPGSKSMNIELQGLANNQVYQNTNHVDKNKQKYRHKTLNYQN
ncbi:hypothetical protein ABPG74_017971 [Tetrahymena malaccensis]